MKRQMKPLDRTPLMIPAIDGLRGMAILMVLAVHTVDHVLLNGNQNWAIPFLERYFKAGVVGVELFFLISAFTLFQRMEERRGLERYPTFFFFIRRIFRIIPLWWMALLVQVILTDDPVSHRNILAHTFMYFGFTHDRPILFTEWSLFVEEAFYVCLPFLFPFLRHFSYAILFFILALSVQFAWPLNSFSAVRAHFPLVPEIVARYFYCFFLGILLHKIYFGQWKGKSLFQQRVWPWVFDLLTLTGIVVLVWRERVLATLSMTALLLVAVSGRGFFARLTGTRWLGSFGKRSYSIYLLHPILVPPMERFGNMLFDSLGVSKSCIELRILLIMPIYVFASWFIAGLTLRWIERPYIELGKNWIRLLETKRLKEKLRPDLAADS